MLVRAFRDKVFEEVDRVTHLVRLVNPSGWMTGRFEGFVSVSCSTTCWNA